MKLTQRYQIAAGFALLCSSLPAATIFSEDFLGTGSLNTNTPEGTPEGNWVASDQFAANGVISAIGSGGSSGGSATVAFTPVDGLIYTLDTSFTGVSGDGNWLALGFGDGQSTLQSSGNRFVNNSLIGKAWMIYRGDTTTNGNNVFAGSATNGTSGTSAPWSPDFAGGGDIDLRIQLDTTGGAGSWSATWFAKRPADAGYTEVGAAPLVDETITSVGIAQSSSAVTGTVTNFELSSIPEPSSALLLGLGALGLLRRRR